MLAEKQLSSCGEGASGRHGSDAGSHVEVNGCHVCGEGIRNLCGVASRSLCVAASRSLCGAASRSVDEEVSDICHTSRLFCGLVHGFAICGNLEVGRHDLLLAEGNQFYDDRAPCKKSRDHPGALSIDHSQPYRDCLFDGEVVT